jgi:signal transduction histidine kinase
MNHLRNHGPMLDGKNRTRAPDAVPTGDHVCAQPAAGSTRSAANDQRGEDPQEEFLAMVLHELRNPLGDILNAIDLLRDAESLPPQHRWIWGGVERAARQVQCLTNDLLCLSQATQTAFQLNLQRLDFAALARTAVERHRPAFEREGLQLIHRSTEEAMPVFADPDRLDFVFGNLLDNAAKYNEAGSQVTVSVAAAGDEIELCVQDTGIGIAPEVLPFIFDPFVREGVPAGRPTRGSGVGLFLVRTLVELHGGRVEAFSAGRGQGSQFVVRLPGLDVQ